MQPSFEMPLPHLTSTRLQPAATEEELALHAAALQWSLADPIVIERAEDVKSKVNWQDRIQPFHHQMQNLMTFCRRLPVTLIADDVGLGKTISAGLILSELTTRRRVNRTLVLCPSILGPQWVEEMESKFGIYGRFATGNQLGAELRSEIPLVVTTYESASRRLDDLDQDAFDMLILDEAHKLRNLYGTQSPPKLAQRVHKALQNRLFKYVLMLTATPIQNRLWDLYTLVDCLAVAKGHQNPLGSAAEFQRNYIADGATARVLKPGKSTEFRNILKQYLARTRRDEVRLAFPQREVKLMQVPPTPQESALMKLVAERVESLGGFEQSSLLQAMMSSPAALLAQLGNMKNRSLGTLQQTLQEQISGGLQAAKLQGLLNIASQLRAKRGPTWRMVVFTIRKETQRVIGEALEQAGIAVGYIRGGEPQRNRTTVNSYTAEPPAVNVIVSTDAGAEGVNLQAGNVVVNYDLPWNPMIVEQRIGRVQRLASKFGHVVVVNLAVAGSPEATVVARLMQKLQTISDSVGDIESVLEGSGDDDDGSNFEAQIRNLVVKSLKGQDVVAAAQQAEDSIQRARELFESNRDAMNQQLGDLHELHETGPIMPRLTPIAPEMPYREFVVRALAAEGATLERKNDEQFTVRRSHHPDEEITFDEQNWHRFRSTGYFMGRPLRLYIPGKPAFERLVERWLHRSSHRVLDLSNQSQTLAESMISSWLTKIPGAALESIHVQPNQFYFQGTTICRVSAVNSLDSYEKLIHVAHTPPSHGNIALRIPSPTSWMSHELDPEATIPGVFDAVLPAVSKDPDVSAFAKFYSARLSEEFTKAGKSAELRKKVTDDLAPRVHGQILSMHGTQYRRCRTDFQFSIDGQSGYSLQLELIPAIQSLLTEVPWGQCGETGRQVPECCLERCQLTNKLALRHLLTTSDVSGRRVLVRQSERCSISGKLAALDEFGTSDVSGTRASLAGLISSPIRGRRGLKEEFATCSFTGDAVLNDELRTSEISGRVFRCDQEASSAVCGTRGHRSEFIVAADAGELVLPHQCALSDVDGKLSRRDRLVESDRLPHRVGRPEQVIRCQATGRLLLCDEVDRCDATGKTVDRELLVSSDDSDRMALADAIVTCSLSGKRILPDETVASVVSGRVLAKSVAQDSPVSRCWAAPEEFVRCEITGASVLPNELALSAVSQRSFRKDEAVLSEFSGRCGHLSESVTCDFTRKNLLADEFSTSQVSGRRTAAARLVSSQRSGRKCDPSEVVRCEASGVFLCMDEVGVSAVSGKKVDLTLLHKSPISGNLALQDELVRCEVSGVKLLPKETDKCTATQRQVDRRLLVRSEISNNLVLHNEVARCAISGRRGAPSEFVWCQLTHQPVLPEFTETCIVSGLKARRDGMRQSAVSGKWVLAQHAVRSFVDQRICARSEAFICHWNQGYLLPEQSGTCRRTKLTFAKGQLDSSHIFKPLDQLMKGQVSSAMFPDLVPVLRKLDKRLASASRAWGVLSPKRQVAAICVEISEYLGLKVRYVAVMVALEGETRIIGEIS